MEIKIGDIFSSLGSGYFQVVNYENSRNVTVEFLDTGYISTTSVSNVKEGSVKDYYRPSVQGVGFLGEGGFTAYSQYKRNISYTCWCNMLKRCYNEEFQQKYSTYKGCSVCVEWHNFQNFAKYHTKYCEEGFHLDKDLLFKGNKLYSPETCVFVPQWINKFLCGSDKARGRYKVGVSLTKRSATNPYTAQINNNKGLNKNLGYFPTEEQAYQVWLKAKLQQALEYKPEMDEIDLRIYPNVVEIIKEM